MNHSTIQTKIERLFASPQITRQDRVYALLSSGYSQRQMADELGVTKAAVCQTLSGTMTSKHIAQRLSEITGVPLHQLYPDGRYALTQEAA